MMERRNDPTHDYILRLTGKDRPRVLFVGTATGDDTAYIVSFYSTYDSDRCAPHHLPLFHRAVDDLAGFVKGFDVIHNLALDARLRQLPLDITIIGRSTDHGGRGRARDRPLPR